MHPQAAAAQAARAARQRGISAPKRLRDELRSLGADPNGWPEVARIMRVQTEREARGRRFFRDPRKVPEAFNLSFRLSRWKRDAPKRELKRRLAATVAALPAATMWSDRERSAAIEAADRREFYEFAAQITLGAVTRLIARQAGWHRTHTSTRGGRASGSRYFEHASGARLRVSDHELPTAEDRPWSMAAQERTDRYERFGRPQRAEILIDLDWDRPRWLAELGDIIADHEAGR